jgi:acyl-CoA thioesterase FadM
MQRAGGAGRRVTWNGSFVCLGRLQPSSEQGFLEGDVVSGLLRNFIAFFLGLFAQGSKAAADVTTVWFWVTPFDAGLRVLKSDKFLQFAETAQIDYLLKVGKLFSLIRGGVGFVNLAQVVTFARPAVMFSRVWVETQLMYADEKCAYFSHTMHAGGSEAAQVVVKMKFKKGRITVPPLSVLPVSFADKPAALVALDAALAA